MQVEIDKILKERNKTRYWLSKETGITYTNISNLANNKTSSIKFEVLESICEALECSPNDILILKKGDDMDG